MATEGTFYGRIEALMDLIGDGTIIGMVEFDQAYAHRQHEELAWKHPRGGQAQYLAVPFYANLHSYLERIADHVLRDGGPELGMIICMELLAAESSSLAPIEVGTLRASAHPSVEREGVMIYDRPPGTPRLSDPELDAIHDMVSDLTHPDAGLPREWGHNKGRTSGT